MTSEELLKVVKTSLRVVSDAYDDEINHLISAGQEDISQACDSEFDMDDNVQCNAVVMYVKANFSVNQDEKAYELYQKRLQCIGLRKMKDKA